jgi:fibronectin-binding autotransporter adhesin
MTRRILLPLALCTATLATSSAAVLTWDLAPGSPGSGDAAVTGGTGTWNTTNGNWTADSGANNVGWNNATPDSATFGGTAGTITLGEAITANSLVFNTAGYIIEGSTLTLAGTTPTITNSVSATINSIIGGSAGFTKAGTGNLTLGAANSYTGMTNLGGGAASGTLTLGVNNAIADSAGVAFSGPTGATGTFATLAIGNTTQTIKSLSVTAGPASGQTASALITGSGGSLTVTGGGSNLLVTHNGAGTQGTTSDAITHLDLSGVSSYAYDEATAKVEIRGGAAANNRGARLTLGADASFTALSFEIQNTSAPSGDKRESQVLLGNETTINADSIIVLGTGGKDNGILRYRTGLSGAPSLTIRGTAGGTSRADIHIAQITSGTNASNGATGSIDLVTGASASVLDARVGTLNIGSRTTGGSSTTANFSMGAGTLDATSINVGNVTSSTTTLGSSFSVGNGGLVKVGTLTLGTRSNGTLTSTFTLGGGAVVAAQTIQNGSGTATRAFNWNDGTIRNYDAATDLTVGSNLTLAATGSHVFEIGTGRTGTVTGAIGEAAAGGSLTKNGQGKLVLESANSYTGATTVNAGTLHLGTGGSIGVSTTNIGANATLSGIGSIGGNTTISGIHTPGNSPGLQSFGGGLSYTETATLLWELTDNTTTGRGTSFDGVNVTGGIFALDGGASIDLAFSGTVDLSNVFWTSSQEWLVIDLSGGATAGDSNGFSLGDITLGGDALDPTAFGNFGVLRKPGSNTADSVYLTWTPVPEPSAVLLGSLGLLLIFRRRMP